MKKAVIAIAGLVGLLTLAAIFNNTRSYLAASSVSDDYNRCERNYELLGKEERFVKNSTEVDMQSSGHKMTLEVMRRTETSCANYYRYWKAWGSSKLPPSDNLFWALISRYEPERLKQK